MIENKIINGDCKNLNKHLEPESVDLIYLDPPFFSNQQFEVLWGNGEELKAYGDRWKGGVNHYIEWMRPRIQQCYDALKRTGSFYLHCDYHAVYELRNLCNDIFKKDFTNEIIWHYQTYQGQVKRYFPRKHDTILFYTKSKKWIFNLLYQDNVKDTINYNRWSKYIVEGNKIKGNFYPKTDSRFMAYYRRWVREHGRDPKSDDVILELTGYVVDDVWDIQAVDPKSKKRLGYPTQKPEELLERIILSSSNKGDLVVDPFVGGGTTIAVANRLKRRYIGIDVSPIACCVSYKRLKGKINEIKAKKNKIQEITQTMTIKEILDIVDYPVTRKDVKKLDGFQFQQWAIIQLGANISPSFTSDGGIDGKFVDGTPIEVKQSSVGRPVIQKLHSAVITDKKMKGVVVGDSFSPQAYEQIAKIKQSGITIIPMTIQDLINRDFQKIKEAKIKMTYKKDLTKHFKSKKS